MHPLHALVGFCCQALTWRLNRFGFSKPARRGHSRAEGNAKCEKEVHQDLTYVTPEGKNGYLMIIVADDKDAYCAYTGGWAQTSEHLASQLVVLFLLDSDA